MHFQLVENSKDWAPLESAPRLLEGRGPFRSVSWKSALLLSVQMFSGAVMSRKNLYELKIKKLPYSCFWMRLCLTLSFLWLVFSRAFWAPLSVKWQHSIREQANTLFERQTRPFQYTGKKYVHLWNGQAYLKEWVNLHQNFCTWKTLI
jgi:hypothetical protein